MIDRDFPINHLAPQRDPEDEQDAADGDHAGDHVQRRPAAGEEPACEERRDHDRRDEADGELDEVAGPGLRVARAAEALHLEQRGEQATDRGERAEADGGGDADALQRRHAAALVRVKGLSGKSPRWMTRGTRREARTQDAPICRHIGASEDAASRRVTPVRRPGLLSGQALRGEHMAAEAQLEQVDSGLAPVTDGWFVVNVRDAAWLTNDAFGGRCVFEGAKPVKFGDLGITLAVLEPGKPSGMYHAESNQEDFLVLAGECLLLVEG